ncbi:MAG: DUF59 domain-containing protein [Euryarchaeota archaeon]|nr:DUF59 domain-containing protein [Euryarchaeota archaeon]MDE1836280.1 DUF59 domain-containing protein [Euryarchaeota archaeon]MDE1880908.1 DUF59 domain-containing protein [Euryarchaeota archaeon]MDE2044324.1 DUF59 domain-containing protein [Thermoplasmata archaeon]
MTAEGASPVGDVSASTSASPAGAPPATAPSPAGSPPAPGSRQEKELLIKKALKKIYDPEIPMNIVDLGLIYGYEWSDDTHVTVRMTMTGPGCPVAGILAEEVKSGAETVPGIAEAKVDVVWEPPWGPEKMSDFAKRQFGYL